MQQGNTGTFSIRPLDDSSQNELHSFCACLCPGEAELASVSPVKLAWYEKQRSHGFRVLLAFSGQTPLGMIQYGPVESSWLEGKGCMVVYCIWIPPKKRLGGIQARSRGIGTALLAAAEEDARRSGSGGMAAWGLALPLWMRAGWFRKHGYRVVERQGMMRLLYKTFESGSIPPRWRSPAGQPAKHGSGPVRLTVLSNGWCPAMNMVMQRARDVASEFGNAVSVDEISTADPAVMIRLGESDMLYIDDRPVSPAPPVSPARLRRLLARAIKRHTG